MISVSCCVTAMAGHDWDGAHSSCMCVAILRLDCVVFVTGLFTQYLIFTMFGMMFDKTCIQFISAVIYCC